MDEEKTETPPPASEPSPQDGTWEDLGINSLADLERYIRSENPNLEPLICKTTKKEKASSQPSEIKKSAEPKGETKQIGEICIDSGTCWIGDPCYTRPSNPFPTSGNYKKFKAGIAVTTGIGDGFYPVFAEITNGLVKNVFIDFDTYPESWPFVEEKLGKNGAE